MAESRTIIDKTEGMNICGSPIAGSSALDVYELNLKFEEARGCLEMSMFMLDE